MENSKIKELERRIAILEMSLFDKSGTHWHETGILPTGEKYGRIGASTHLVDDKGYPITKGYHSITAEFPGLHFTGKTGATVKRFNIDTDRLSMILSRIDKPRID